jgi:hypothetical protein
MAGVAYLGSIGTCRNASRPGMPAGHLRSVFEPPKDAIA